MAIEIAECIKRIPRARSSKVTPAMRLPVSLLLLSVTIGARDFTEWTSKQKNDAKLSTPEECARHCKTGEPPKTCYYHFTVEYYGTLTNACKLCTSNATAGITADCQCITADGYEVTGLITANRMYPGPSIMVCKHDLVVIDVMNRVPGNAITIHWHGLLQNGHQYYDGVPYVTQCPITDGSTFRYQWQAKNAGTHFWHAHSGLHKAEALDGPVVVREPKSEQSHRRLWDYDEFEDFIFITDWFHDSAEDHFPGTLVRNPGQLPDNFLINGRGRWTDPVSGITTSTPLTTLTVQAGRRHRFRLINSCTLTCSVILTIEGHNLTVIETDGEPVEPVNVTSITSASAERYDFVVNANQSPGSYWIQVRALGECAPRKLQQFGVLRYEHGPTEPEHEQPTYDRPLPEGIVLNPLNVHCTSPHMTDVVCVSQMNSVKPVPKEVLEPKPDIRLYLPITFHDLPTPEIFEPGVFRKFVVVGQNQSTALLGNISNVLPSSPLISQRGDIPPGQICSNDNLPAKCINASLCECSHVVEIPLNSMVELVLVDETNVSGLSHPFHLHGHAFYVMGEGFGKDYDIDKMTVAKVKDLDSKGLIERRFARPPTKDTYAVPNNGFSVIRFPANNPGYWLLHCHFLFHLVGGMGLVFHVGNHSDLPPIPQGFPKCGNFKPPIIDF